MFARRDRYTLTTLHRPPTVFPGGRLRAWIGYLAPFTGRRQVYGFTCALGSVILLPYTSRRYGFCESFGLKRDNCSSLFVHHMFFLCDERSTLQYSLIRILIFEKLLRGTASCTWPSLEAAKLRSCQAGGAGRAEQQDEGAEPRVRVRQVTESAYSCISILM